MIHKSGVLWVFAALAVLPGCGRDDACADQDCTALGDCPLYECACKSSQTSVLSNECITDEECCANEETACTKACADLGGWAK